MFSPSAQVIAKSSADPARAFAYIVPIPLPKVFTGYGPLPAVSAVTEQSGAWDAAGQTRIVHLSDGSTARETLTRYEHPAYFSYTVRAFSNALRFLTGGAQGEWWFEPAGDGGTLIRWRYAFGPRSPLSAPILWLLTRLLWGRYMQKALAGCIAELKGEA
jgi:hypothetical protein